MTTPRPLPRTRHARIAAALGGSLLAASAILTAGTGVAAAATATEILTAACTHHYPIPSPWSNPQRLSDCHGANLAGANLDGVNLIGVNLTGADLTGANLTSANLSSAQLDGANLTGANLTSANLYGANWDNTNLTNTNLTSANLRYAYLPFADLTTTTLKNTDLEGADLIRAKLTGVDLTGANLTDATLTGANLTDANLTSANLYNAKLIRANLTGANLYNAKLIRANLTRANLTGANLDGADLTGANLDGVNLTGDTVTEAPAFLDITTSYRARFCSEAKDGNNIAFQVNEGQRSDYGDHPPEDTWHGQWMSNVTFDTWVSDVSFPGGMGMWCHTVVRTDLQEGDWVRLAGWNPSGSMTDSLTEVVGVNGAVTERLVMGEGWAAAIPSCCFATHWDVRAPHIPDPIALTGTVGTSLTRTFTTTGTPTPAVTVVDPAKLPPGTTFANDPITGVPTLSGTPTTAGKYDFTLTAANGVGTPKTLGVTMTVVPIPVAPVFADTTPVALTSAVGTRLTRTFTATGTPNPTVTVVDPAKLPPGTTFANDPVTGVPTLSGTPTVAGKFDFMVTATNGTTPNATLPVTVNVTAAPVVDPPAAGSLGSLFGS